MGPRSGVSRIRTHSLLSQIYVETEKKAESRARTRVFKLVRMIELGDERPLINGVEWR